jgi:hypothetical protein
MTLTVRWLGLLRLGSALACPKMVKNGVYSSFVYWSVIWACLTDNLDCVERWQITGFHQTSMEVEFYHKPLKPNLVRLARRGTQEG